MADPIARSISSQKEAIDGSKLISKTVFVSRGYFFCFVFYVMASAHESVL